MDVVEICRASRMKNGENKLHMRNDGNEAIQINLIQGTATVSSKWKKRTHFDSTANSIMKQKAQVNNANSDVSVLKK